MQDPELWTRLQGYEIARDGPDFAARVAKIRDIGARAPAAIEEYRRFLYLTQVSREPATPSVAIDRIWHLHMTSTRDYWEVLCGEILGRPLHHDPAGDGDRSPQFRYARTCELYEDEFGAPPPNEFWPRRLPDAQRDRLHAAGWFAGWTGLTVIGWAMTWPLVTLLAAIMAVAALNVMIRSTGTHVVVVDGGDGGSGCGGGGCGDG